MSSRKELMLPRSARGSSCAATIKAALEDTQLRPEVLHIVGAGDAERSMDFEVLASALPAKARVVLALWRCTMALTSDSCDRADCGPDCCPATERREEVYGIRVCFLAAHRLQISPLLISNTGVLLLFGVKNSLVDRPEIFRAFARLPRTAISPAFLAEVGPHAVGAGKEPSEERDLCIRMATRMMGVARATKI
ncbi:unnamed protein product [Effrenium voratum]|nr:unnamed protein product [Effrenium voratum]